MFMRETRDHVRLHQPRRYIHSNSLSLERREQGAAGELLDAPLVLEQHPEVLHAHGLPGGASPPACIAAQV